MKPYLIFAILGLIWLFSAVLASAHGTIQRTDPPNGSKIESAPAEVKVWFDEALVPDSGKISVINVNGEQVDQDDTRHDPIDPTLLIASLKPDLPEGSYIISASGVLVSDGDTAQGSSVFWIDNKNRSNALKDSSPPADFRVLAFFLGLLIVASVSGYWWIFYRTPPLEVTPPDQAVTHFPLE